MLGSPFPNYTVPLPWQQLHESAVVTCANDLDGDKSNGIVVLGLLVIVVPHLHSYLRYSTDS